MSDIESKAVDLMDKIEAITEKYAPDVAEAAIEATRISAIGDLVSTLACLVMLLAGVYGGLKLSAFFVRRKEADGYWSDWEMLYVPSYAITVIAGAMGLIGFVFGISDTWMWVTIFNPELGLAHKLSGL